VTQNHALSRLGEFVVVNTVATGLQPLGRNSNGWDQGNIYFTPNASWLAPPAVATRMIAEAAEGLPHVLQVHVSTQARPQQQQQGDDHQAGFSFWNMSDSSQNSNNGTDSSSCMTEPKTGYGADDGLAGKPHSCGPGLAWCNGFTTANAAACAAACCAVKPTGTSTAVCGGYTWDPKQADASGSTRCPVGRPCCWLKMSPSALGKGPARYQGAIRASALPKPASVLDVLASSNAGATELGVRVANPSNTTAHAVLHVDGWPSRGAVVVQELAAESPMAVRAEAVVSNATVEQLGKDGWSFPPYSFVTFRMSK
jgi:hypothetical protein